MKQCARIRVAAAAALIAGALAVGAPSRAQPVPEAVAEAGTSGSERRAVYDPWVEMNRGIFAFNEYLDRWLLEPVATGWDWVVPDPSMHANFSPTSPRRSDRERPVAGQARQGRQRPGASRSAPRWPARVLRSGRAPRIAPGDEDLDRARRLGRTSQSLSRLRSSGRGEPRDAAGSPSTCWHPSSISCRGTSYPLRARV
jgi:hypothetical protein